MNLFSIWPKLGFRENPYTHTNLTSDDTGDRLLVGRDQEVSELQLRIGSTGTHPSLEGPAGVGKSSLLAVAGYRMLRRCVDAAEGTLFVPATRFFQASNSLEEFEAQVYWDVAQTLIDNVEAFRKAGLAVPDISSLDKWLNSPQYREMSGTLAMLGGGYGSEPNATEGFVESGFPAAVRRELERCFPSAAAGGVICVLDNLELLQSSGEARRVLEALRDRIFNMHGLRWILCGSRGIVSRARSERLSGIFDPPMRLGSLPYEAASELVARRIDYYGEPEAYPPVTPQGFKFLYGALNLNLRDALAYAQRFSDWVYREYVIGGGELPAHNDRDRLIEAWLAERADEAHADTQAVQRRVWQFFDKLAESGGRCGASEWQGYDFTTQQQLSSSVTALENSNLVVREMDPDKASRSIAAITPEGWLVYFYRNRYQLPSHTSK